jgi:hypothetical protein
MTASHAVTLNGRITTQLAAGQGKSIQEELYSRLALLDGTDRFALLLWRIPDGVPFDLVDLASGPPEYIQCAGGISGRFTCEIRRFNADGDLIHEVIGRLPSEETSTLRHETVEWGKNETTVQQNEVLGLEDLRELFWSYVVSGQIPTPYVTRMRNEDDQ